ncbi:MAG: DUF1588 domain-containing protein [Polyangiales bacterium]
MILRRSLVGLLAVIAACTSGLIEQPSEPFRAPDGSPSLPGAEAPGGGASGGAGSDDFAPAAARLRKLTVEQYQNSVSDLLGEGITVPTDLEPDTAQNGFYAIGASNATVSPAAAEKFERAAYDVAAQALAPDHRKDLVPCTPAATSDSGCARKFVQKLGLRAFRRPLTDAELTTFVKLADDAAKTLNDFHAGLEFALAGLLQSPSFLFRAELGEPDPDDAKRLRYTSYELASRLSYAVWNTTPDDVLLTAAEGGKLDRAGLMREAERMLSGERAKRALDSFHAERLGLADLAGISKAESVIDAVDDGLRTALRDDVLRTFAELSRTDTQDILEVFDTKVVFVNDALAEIYGLSMRPGALTKAELPDSTKRLGFIGKPAFLALAAHNSETSPTLRGKYIRERVLCQSIPAPPPNVVPVLGEPDPNAPTMRDRLRVHATDAACSGCHTLMDPLGLALEHFDPIGRYRKDDHGHALDVTGELDGTAFDGAVELAELLRDDPRTAECLVRQAYRYALGHVEAKGEEPAIDALVSEFERGNHAIKVLFRALIASDAFRYAARGEDSP